MIEKRKKFILFGGILKGPVPLFVSKLLISFSTSSPSTCSRNIELGIGFDRYFLKLPSPVYFCSSRIVSATDVK